MRIPLSDNECKVLSTLCQNRGEIVEREKIYALLGADEGNMGDVYICHLRRKIDNKLGLKLIYTVRGKGYILKN
jgi:DNA-binding response OmpR family regulator